MNVVYETSSHIGRLIEWHYDSRLKVYGNKYKF
jgi:hypothetical protein